MRINAQMVAIDWNFIQTVPKSQLELPHEFAYLLADQVFSEVALKGDKTAGMQAKLHAFVRANRGRLFVSKLCSQLQREEVVPGKPSHVADLVHWPMTQLLRRESLAPVSQWVRACLSNRDAALEEDIRCREHFQALREDYTTWERGQSGRELLRVSGMPQEHREWIQKPEQVSWLAGERGEFSGEEWRRAIVRFPDIHAKPRWARLCAWYCLTYAMGQTRDAQNDFDDASYAFNASYAGLIATADAGLLRTCEFVFPHVRKWVPRQ